jgi:hypothetical protein
LTTLEASPEQFDAFAVSTITYDREETATMADQKEWNDFINAAIEERRGDINSINRLVLPPKISHEKLY